MFDARIVPRDGVLVGILHVVLLAHVVAEEHIRQGFVAMREEPGNVDGHRVVVPDVDRERLAALPVEEYDARPSGQAGEKVVLTPLVVMQALDDSPAREGHVRLP